MPLGQSTTDTEPADRGCGRSRSGLARVMRPRVQDGASPKGSGRLELEVSRAVWGGRLLVATPLDQSVTVQRCIRELTSDRRRAGYETGTVRRDAARCSAPLDVVRSLIGSLSEAPRPSSFASRACFAADPLGGMSDAADGDRRRLCVPSGVEPVKVRSPFVLVGHVRPNGKNRWAKRRS
jgi:hypothetical protein